MTLILTERSQLGHEGKLSLGKKFIKRISNAISTQTEWQDGGSSKQSSGSFRLKRQNRGRFYRYKRKGEGSHKLSLISAWQTRGAGFQECSAWGMRGGRIHLAQACEFV
jgi:hypothetical protein